jgi:hypothetical protein
VIVILGTMLATTMAMTWVLGKTRWDAVDASDPRKAFAVEVYTTMRAKVPGLPRKGAANGNGSNGHYRGNGTRALPQPPEEHAVAVKKDSA